MLELKKALACVPEALDPNGCLLLMLALSCKNNPFPADFQVSTQAPRQNPHNVIRLGMPMPWTIHKWMMPW